MKPNLLPKHPIFMLHRMFARMHGGMPGEVAVAGTVIPEQDDGFEAAYAEYASATALANTMLQEHGARSSQFTNADVASMRLFHRVKKMQGLKKPRS